MKSRIVIILEELKKAISGIGFMISISWKLGKSRFFIAPLTIIIDTVTPLLLITIPKYIIDELTYGRRWKTVLVYVLILTCVTAFSSMYRWGVWYILGRSRARIELRNREVFMNAALHMDYKHHENNDVKDLMERVSKKTDVVKFVESTLVGFFTGLFQLVGYTYILAQLHPLIIVVIIAIIWINSKISEARNKLGYEFDSVVANFARKCNYIYSTMIGFDSGKDIRMNNASQWLKSKYSDETDLYIKSFEKKQNKEFRSSLADSVIGAVQTFIIYGYSAFLTILGKITVGSFSMYLGAITSFISSFNTFISILVDLKYWGYYAEDFKKLMEISKPENEDIIDQSITWDMIEGGDIEFKNVSFKYPGCENYVLRNISITIKNGEKLSVVGYNGAGKSTFIKLICGLYSPTDGVITLNGYDIQRIPINLYRKMLGVVFQDFQLFAFSAKENIILDEYADEERLLWAIEKSGIKDKLRGLDKGIETSISKEFDENGIEFSGGEGQKLASARAYYRNAPIVILDEPTASLDPIAESLLYERFNSIMENMTSIYISHRLASVKFCDKVVVFENGQIVEYGTHHELMATGGVYEKMFSTQAEYYKEGKNEKE